MSSREAFNILTALSGLFHSTELAGSQKGRMVGFSAQADTVDVDNPSKSGIQSFMHSALDVHSQVNTLTFSKGSRARSVSS